MKHAPREHQRVYMTFYLRVFEDEKFLGYLIDISTDGMMFMSEFPLEADKEYNLKMKLPSSLEWKGKKDKDKSISFSGECKWSRNDDVDKEFFLSGIQFSNLSDSDNSIIHQLIQEYKIK